jgi:hypothetical protein
MHEHLISVGSFRHGEKLTDVTVSFSVTNRGITSVEMPVSTV